MSNKDMVLYYKAMADETRLEIIEMLSKENLCACHILEKFDFSQPTLSYHMKILVESNLVLSSKDGNWTRYRLNRPVLNAIGSKFNNYSHQDVVDRKIENC